MTGAWESLLHGRADLILGAGGECPEEILMSGEFTVRSLGLVDWVFAIAPCHPLALASEPIPSAELQLHRAVAVADSSRSMAARTSGLLTGQETLTVPSVRAKLLAQVAGLGCGYLPRAVAAPYLAAGTLIEKQTTATKPAGHCQLAWRTAARGKSLGWFLDRLSEAGALAGVV